MYHFCSENRWSKILVSNCESQKAGFGFDPKNPPRLWILWIHGPFLDLPKKGKIRFWIRKSGFGFSQKKAPQVCCLSLIFLASKNHPLWDDTYHSEESYFINSSPVGKFSTLMIRPHHLPNIKYFYNDITFLSLEV